MSESKIHKQISTEIKQAGEAGEFSAVIATLGTVDSDGDVVLSGALLGQGSVPIVPSHQSSHVPLGKVTIREDGDSVIADGKFNLDVSTARDWFKAIKFDLENGEPKMNWSWGFLITDSAHEKRDGENVRIIKGVDLIEVSPVLRGASVGTRTILAKAEAEEASAEEAATEPDTASEPEAGVKLVDQIRNVTKGAEAVIERLNEAAAQRADRGRELAEETRAEAIEMATAVEEMRQVAKSLSDLVQGCAKGDEVATSLSRWAEHRARWSLTI